MIDPRAPFGSPGARFRVPKALIGDPERQKSRQE